MKIGILSDTHNQIDRVVKAAFVFKSAGIEFIIHCGDHTDPKVLKSLKGFTVNSVFGNGDFDQIGIKNALQALGNGSQCAQTLETKIGGKHFFVAHGNNDKLIHEAVNSGKYDFVLQGHTHRFKDETIGKTRWINPGALGGLKPEQRSIAILDLGSGQLERILIDEMA